MSATTLSHAISSFQPHKSHASSGFQNGVGSFSVTKGYGIDLSLLKSISCCSGRWKMGGVHASSSQSTVADPFQSPSSKDASDPEKKSNVTTLILMRHGQSLWNEKNLFTGCVDVPLTEKGVDEAIEAGRRISNIPIDIVFTSRLIRAQMTAMLALSQHCSKKVPIIKHDESEQAMKWSQVYSEETEEQSIPVVTAWQLNERMYGELQGLNKQETADKFGKEIVHGWRRSYDIPPPNGESLEMCAGRAVSYFKEQIEPKLLSGKHVMIAAHANSLRSIIMYLDKLNSQEVISLELATGVPMLYVFKEGQFIRRGNKPVFLCIQPLTNYRQKFDEIVN